jgi:hypothetical protein
MSTPTTSPPKSIETKAFGRLFRSRLEARCAVFLEAMGLRWEYEPEGFELPSGRYLPDFKVCDSKLLSGFYWLECKGGIPTDREVQLARELSGATRAAVMFFNGAMFDEIRKDYFKCFNDPYLRDYLDEMDARLDSWRETMGDHHYVQLWGLHSVVGRELSCIGLQDILAVWPYFKLAKAGPAACEALGARFEHGAGYV